MACGNALLVVFLRVGEEGRRGGGLGLRWRVLPEWRRGGGWMDVRWRQRVEAEGIGLEKTVEALGWAMEIPRKMRRRWGEGQMS